MLLKHFHQLGDTKMLKVSPFWFSTFLKIALLYYKVQQRRNRIYDLWLQH